MAQATALQNRRILVVEDDYLVAQNVVEMLEDEGAVVVGPVGSVADAIVLLQRDEPAFDTAVLDVNLHGQTSYPIADVLAARGVHVVFLTGYEGSALDEAYRHFPRCEKPFQTKVLLAALSLSDQPPEQRLVNGKDEG